MATLRDVARATGFSVTTVSRALRGCDDVTEQTRVRIEAVARQLNYRPNQIARKLVSGRSGLVGLVLGSPPQSFEYGHFFELIAGLSQAFAARELDFVLEIGDGTNKLAMHERLINRGVLDGFVLTFPVIDDPCIDLLLERDAAFVVHGHQFGDKRYAYFDTDNREVSASAVGLLADHGHRRIAILAGPQDWPSVAERIRGYREAMAARCLAIDPALIVHGDTSTVYGAAVSATLLTDLPDRPTAIICCNSLVASGVYKVVRSLGLSVPDDISVVAHDDALPQVQTDYLDPPLTVTKLPLRGAGEPLAELLIRRISGEPVSALQITGQPLLIERQSVARAK